MPQVYCTITRVLLISHNNLHVVWYKPQNPYYVPVPLLSDMATTAGKQKQEETIFSIKA